MNQTTTLLLLLLAIAVIGALAVYASRRADEAKDDTAELRQSLVDHAARVWRAIEELRRDDT